MREKFVKWRKRLSYAHKRMKIAQIKSTLTHSPRKHTFSFWVDFTRLNDSKWYTQAWVIWVNTNLIKNIIVKNAVREISVYWIGFVC